MSLFGSILNTGRDVLFGQRPEDVQLPTEYTAAQEALDRLRQQRAEQLAAAQAAQAAGQRTDVGQAIVSQAERQARQAQQDAAAQARSAVAGQRGLGALSAQRAATTAGILGGAQAAGDIRSAAAARADQADIQRTEGLFSQMLELERQRQQQALLEQQMREQQADSGLFGTLLGIGGTAIGGVYGGAQGAQIGGQLGYGLGEAASPYLR